MIWTSVTGEVSSSSIVPDRFSSEYVRIVMTGIRNRRITATLRSTYRIICWLMFAVPPPPICIICSLCRTKIVRYT